MDPLQAFSQEWQTLVGGAAAAQPAIEATDLESLRSWQDEAEDAAPAGDTSSLVFPLDAELNGRVYLFEGKIWNLRIDCIINTTNEGMTDRTGVSGQILQHAGPQLEEEIYQTEGCRTGECRMTRAYLLPCKKIIHTVGPRYNERYVTAAESALHYCYRNAMEIAVENKLTSLAASCVYTERKGYPRREAAHIAIRTVRRFLEQFSSNRMGNRASESGLSHVVFVVDNAKDLAIYRELLRMYFPRNLSDVQFQKENLPADVGNEKGEPVVVERQVRISAMPGRDDEGLADCAPRPDAPRPLAPGSPSNTWLFLTTRAQALERVGRECRARARWARVQGAVEAELERQQPPAGRKSECVDGAALMTAVWTGGGERATAQETEVLADTDAESFQSFACMTNAPDASRLAGSAPSSGLFSPLFRSFPLFSALFRSFPLFSALFPSFPLFSPLFPSFPLFSPLFPSFPLPVFWSP